MLCLKDALQNSIRRLGKYITSWTFQEYIGIKMFEKKLHKE